jgi:hypothetical protein
VAKHPITAAERAPPRCWTYLATPKPPLAGETRLNNAQIRSYQSSSQEEAPDHHKGTTSVFVDDDSLDHSLAVGKPASIHDAVTDPNDFQASATDLLQELANSVVSMRHKNDPFEVNLSKNFDALTIDMGSNGRLSLEIDEVNKCISMESPYSGSYNFFLSEETREWLGINYSHKLKGIFVRDLNQNCERIPDL